MKERRFFSGAGLFLPPLFLLTLIFFPSCASPSSNKAAVSSVSPSSNKAAASGAFGSEGAFIEAGGGELRLLEPERFEQISSGKSRLTFKSAKHKAAVYLNSEFLGLTPLEVNDLIPGRYFFLLKKEGFKSVRAAVQVRDGMSDFFYFEMELEDEAPAPASRPVLEKPDSAPSETEKPMSAGTLAEEP